MKSLMPNVKKTIETLGRNDCRWPNGDPRHPDFHFCGAARSGDRPYCDLHWRLAFQPPKGREPQRVPAVSPAAPQRRAA